MIAPLQKVLTACESTTGHRATQSGAGWSTRCPAHEDRSPSLSISETPDGRVLVNCHAGCCVDEVLDAVGLEAIDLFPATSDTFRHGMTSIVARRTDGKSESTTFLDGKAAITALSQKYGHSRYAQWVYHDSAGNPVGLVCRWDTDTGKQIRPVSRTADGRWAIRAMAEPRPLYRQNKLRFDAPIDVLEGEKAADAAASMGLNATTWAGGAKAIQKAGWSPLKGRQVRLWPDHDEPGEKCMQQLASILEQLSCDVITIRLADGWPDCPPKGDLADFNETHDGKCAVDLHDRLEDIAEKFGRTAPGDESQNNSTTGGKPKQATTLVSMVDAAGIELSHSPGADADSFASVPIDDHWETWRIGAKGFRLWLQRRYWQKYRSVPNSQALQDAIGVLRGKSLFDGPEYPVFVRLAEVDGVIWLDLANEKWQVVRIDATGWRIENTSPVRFVRPRGMLPLPRPERGGRVDDLRRFLNIGNDDDWLLVLAWLIAALRPSGPYPALGIHGEQGSAKSNACRVLRALIDPNQVDLRSEPRNEHDLVIAASNSRVVALENVSQIRPWLSDALCRLSTGGGFGTRELYSDDEEKLFSAMRPVLLNGITEVATRPDLLDRSILVTLPRIPEQDRRTESELWREFDMAKPRILGALLDAVSTALSNLDDVRLPCKPRMADFAVWGCAAEPAMNCVQGAFLAAYSGNRETANQAAVEGSIVAEPLQEFMSGREDWEGTATELKDELENIAGERTTKQKAWPKRPNLLSGELSRIAPNLRQIGIDVDIGKQGGRRFVRITRTAVKGSVQSVQSDPRTENLPSQRPTASHQRPKASGNNAENPEEIAPVDARGAAVADSQDSSDVDEEWGEL